MFVISWISFIMVWFFVWFIIFKLWTHVHLELSPGAWIVGSPFLKNEHHESNTSFMLFLSLNFKYHFYILMNRVAWNFCSLQDAFFQLIALRSTTHPYCFSSLIKLFFSVRGRRDTQIYVGLTPTVPRFVLTQRNPSHHSENIKHPDPRVNSRSNTATGSYDTAIDFNLLKSYLEISLFFWSSAAY